MAVLPSADRATEKPCCAAPVHATLQDELVAPVPTILGPCWLQTPFDLVKNHRAPVPPLSSLIPMTAVLPSAEIATGTSPAKVPWAFEPTSLLPCWLQAPLLRVKIQAAPAGKSSPDDSIMVLPSAERPT